MLKYKDKNLNIDDSLISKYERLKGRSITEKDIDNLFRIAYMWKSAHPDTYVCCQTEEELSKTLTKIIQTDIKHYA